MLHNAPPLATPDILTLADVLAAEHTPWQAPEAPQSTYELLRQASARYRNRPALRFVATGALDAPVRTLSYRALFEQVTKAANALMEAGVRPGQAVALLMSNLPETHAALWGAQAAGIASPINPFLETEHIAAIVKATDARVLVTPGPDIDSAIWEKARALVALCDSIRTVFVVGLPEQPPTEVVLPAGVLAVHWQSTLSSHRGDQMRPHRVIKGDDICACFHTGGTTGLPKIAVHSHRNEVFAATMLARMQPRQQVILSGLPLFHVNGAIVTGLGAFHAGWEVVMLTAQGYRGEEVMSNFWGLVQRFKATSFSGVPTIFAALADLRPGSADISSLKTAFCGAAPLAPEVARRFETVAGIPLCEGYGLTEAACISAVHPAGVARRPRSVGLRLPFQQLQAWQVDGAGKGVRLCKPGEVGVIGICGPNVFPGYLNVRDNEGIWLQPGWLNTGDLGFVDPDGFVYLTGRAKDLIIRGGHNIDPALIEESLLRHPAVAAVAAVGQPDLHAGELPVAFVTLKSAMHASPEQLLDAARGLVSERAAVPVRVIILPRLPLTAVGKIAKAELRLRAAEYVFGLLLASHDIEATVTAAFDATRGAVARVGCLSGRDEDIAAASALLAPFPYVFQFVAPGEVQ